MTFTRHGQFSWFWNDPEKIKQAMAQSRSTRELLRSVGMSSGPKCYDLFHRALAYHGLEERYGNAHESRTAEHPWNVKGGNVTRP